MSHFAIRTVRDGKVRINGRWFRPSEVHLPYDGRLDEQRFAFGLYPVGHGGIGRFVSLWGTEVAFRKPAAFHRGPEVVDGKLPWLWWHEEKTP